MDETASNVPVPPALELRVKTLEDWRREIQGATKLARLMAKPLFTGATVLGLIGLYTLVIVQWMSKSNAIDGQAKEIQELKAALATKTAELKAATDKVDGDLRFWERRGFRPVQDFFQAAEFLSAHGATLTLDVIGADGQHTVRTVTLAADAIIERDGRRVAWADLQLAPKTPLRFLLDEKDRISGLKIEAKK